MSGSIKSPAKGQEMYPLDKLLFRRQFILGPHFVQRLKSWRKLKIRDSLYLTVHPDLPLLQTDYRDMSLTLLGYILDPYEPKANDNDIINRLIRQINATDDIFQHTENLGGRWILILDDGEDIRLFNDATGLRQVFYTSDTSQTIWCASQPGIIAEELNLGIDDEARHEFIDSPEFKNNIEYWWPGDSSPFKEIQHLLPNHYLDLKKGVCIRYWPDKKLDYISLEKGVEKSAEIVKGLIKSAFNRFDLAFTITAGLDTRVLLAASREVSGSVYYYTLLCYGLTKESPDVKIPSELLSKLGIKHSLIVCPSHMDGEFKEIYKRNVSTAHDGWGNTAQGIYWHYPQEKVSVKGNAIEAARCFYYRTMKVEKVDARELAKLTEMGENPFAVKHFESWLSEAEGIANRCNINILDLFYWEQRMGNWQAMSQLEWDIAQEVFTPFNCRSLLTTLLSVDKKYRRPPDYKLFKKLIIYFWPEALAEKINPKSWNASFLDGLVRLLIRVRLYRFVQAVLKTIRAIAV